jgi:hypothetical protein
MSYHRQSGQLPQTVTQVLTTAHREGGHIIAPVRQCPVCYPPAPPVSTSHVDDSRSQTDTVIRGMITDAVGLAETDGAVLALRSLVAFLSGYCLMGAAEGDALSARLQALATR